MREPNTADKIRIHRGTTDNFPQSIQKFLHLRPTNLLLCRLFRIQFFNHFGDHRYRGGFQRIVFALIEGKIDVPRQ